MLQEAQRSTERPREIKRDPERYSEDQRGPEMPRKTQTIQEKSTGAQRDRAKPREPSKALRHTENRREAQRGKERWKALGTRGGSIHNNLFLVLVEEKPSSRLPRKALGVLAGSAHDRLLTKPVKERAISEPRECPRRHYEVRGERSRPKTTLLVHKYVIRLMLFWTVALT